MASYRDVTPCLKNREVVDFTVFLYFCKKNVMKKCLVILVVLFSCLCYAQVNAQQLVSTSPTFRNVLIEDFTGRMCVNCPDAHLFIRKLYIMGIL